MKTGKDPSPPRITTKILKVFGSESYDVVTCILTQKKYDKFFDQSANDSVTFPPYIF